MAEVVMWPESQMLMEYEGFRENCALINSVWGIENYGSPAYLVKSDWYKDLLDDKLKERADEDEEWDDLMVIYPQDESDLHF